jgi:catalase
MDNQPRSEARLRRARRLLSLLSNLAIGLVLTQAAFAADPQPDNDLAQQIFDVMSQLPGNKPNTRVVHAKGLVCHGTFEPSKDAAKLSVAKHFAAPVPTLVRYSDAAPDPAVADVSPDSFPRGMAIRFTLPDGKATDIVSFAHNGFVVGTGEDFLGLQKAVVATDPSKPHPWPVEVFVSTRPRALKFVQDSKLMPISFGNEAFFGNNAFIFVDKKGKKQAVRYQIRPVAGQQYLSDADAKQKPKDFLFDELKTHLAQGPIKYHLLIQLPNAGDPTSDGSIVWPDDRKTIELGTITVASVDPDSDTVQKQMGFDPARLTDGIELSDDPLPALRARVYMIARMHRGAQ